MATPFPPGAQPPLSTVPLGKLRKKGHLFEPPSVELILIILKEIGVKKCKMLQTIEIYLRVELRT